MHLQGLTTVHTRHSKKGLAFEDRRSCHLFPGGSSAEVKCEIWPPPPAEARRKTAEVKQPPPRDEN
eukprot:5801970-Pyramimonas_sp.AAC.1